MGLKNFYRSHPFVSKIALVSFLTVASDFISDWADGPDLSDASVQSCVLKSFGKAADNAHVEYHTSSGELVEKTDFNTDRILNSVYAVSFPPERDEGGLKLLQVEEWKNAFSGDFSYKVFLRQRESSLMKDFDFMRYYSHPAHDEIMRERNINSLMDLADYNSYRTAVDKGDFEISAGADRSASENNNMSVISLIDEFTQRDGKVIGDPVAQARRQLEAVLPCLPDHHSL